MSKPTVADYVHELARRLEERNKQLEAAEARADANFASYERIKGKYEAAEAATELWKSRAIALGYDLDYGMPGSENPDFYVLKHNHPESVRRDARRLPSVLPRPDIR